MTRRFWTGFWIVLAVALLVRGAVALVLGNTVSGLSGAHDEISYSMLGQRAAAGYGLTFPSGWYPWIQADQPQSYFSASMSLFLAAIYWVFGYEPLAARLIMALLSTAVVAMLMLLTRQLFNERTALVAGAVAAVYAYLVFYGVTLVTETPFTLAVLAALYIAHSLRGSQTWPKWIWLGLSLAVAVLFRMAVIFWVPILLSWLVYHNRRQRAAVLIPVVVIVLAVAPFTIRNYLLWGHFLLLESQFGHVFWNGNHPGHYGDFHPFKVFAIPDAVLVSRNDAEITNRLLVMGLQNVWNDPVHFAMLTLTRLREFFTFWPTGDSTLAANVLRLVSFGVMMPFMVAGVYQTRRNWRLLAPVWLFAVVHTGVYAVTWTMIRYRIPLDTLLIPFAAVALVSVGDRLRSLRPAGLLPMPKAQSWPVSGDS